MGGEYRYDWMDQYWASNILLATLTDGGTFHSQAQIFLKYWICGTDEVTPPACLPVAAPSPPAVRCYHDPKPSDGPLKLHLLF